MIRDRLGARPLVLFLPIGIESDFKGLVDLVENRAIIWLEESLGAKFEYRDIPDDMKDAAATARRSEEHTSELQSLMRISYAVFCLKKKTNTKSISDTYCKQD